MNDTAIRLLRGALLLAATGMIQVVAQLTLSRMLEILPHPRQSSAPTFYMLAHSVVAVLVLMAGRSAPVTWCCRPSIAWSARSNLRPAC